MPAEADEADHQGATRADPLCMKTREMIDGKEHLVRGVACAHHDCEGAFCTAARATSSLLPQAYPTSTSHEQARMTCSAMAAPKFAFPVARKPTCGQ